MSKRDEVMLKGLLKEINYLKDLCLSNPSKSNKVKYQSLVGYVKHISRKLAVEG